MERRSAPAVLNTVRVAAGAVPLTVAGAPVYVLLGALDRGGWAPVAFERFWWGMILALAGVRVEVRGREWLRPGGSYIIMPNHRSWFDIPVLHRAIGDRDIRWIGKKEIARIPFFGWAFALSRHIAIDRAHRDEAVSAIRQAAAMSSPGVSIVIFPEGTRSTTAEMLPFKKGGFHLAVETGLEILPVAISGTEQVMPKRGRTIRPGTVAVALCEPVSPDGYGKARLRLLMSAVRERIRAQLTRTVAQEVP